MIDVISYYKTNLISAINSIQIQKIEHIVKLLNKAKVNKNNIFLIGNGGSSATPSHSAGDWSKELNIRSICLSDNITSLTAYANDIGYEEVFIEQLKIFLNKDDLVFAYSGSGNSLNVIKAVEYSNGVGAYTIGFTGNYNGNNGGKLLNVAKYYVKVETESMEIIEDTHLIINHMIKELFMKKYNK